MKRVRNLIDVDLMECLLDQNSLIDRMAIDPVLLVDVLYCVCKPQADEAGITDEEFGSAMGGDAIDHATSAFLEALVDFFPKPRREILERGIQIRQAVEGRVMKVAKEKIAELSDEKIDEVVMQIFNEHGERFMKSQES